MAEKFPALMLANHTLLKSNETDPASLTADGEDAANCSQLRRLIDLL